MLRAPPKLRERAMRMVAEVRPDYASEWAALSAVAQKLGIDICRRRSKTRP
jgi:transposase